MKHRDEHKYRGTKVTADDIKTDALISIKLVGLKAVTFH